MWLQEWARPALLGAGRVMKFRERPAILNLLKGFWYIPEKKRKKKKTISHNESLCVSADWIANIWVV